MALRGGHAGAVPLGEEIESGAAVPRAVADVEHEDRRVGLTGGDRRGHHSVGDPEPAPEVLVASDRIGVPAQEAVAVAGFGHRLGAGDVAAAARLGRDRAPLLAGDGAGEDGSALVLPAGLRRVGRRQPEGDHRRVHRRDEGDRRIDGAQPAVEVARRPHRGLHRLPQPTAVDRGDQREQTRVAQLIEVRSLEVAPPLAIGALVSARTGSAGRCCSPRPRW